MPFTFTATFPLVVKDEFKKVATVASFARFRHLSLRELKAHLTEMITSNYLGTCSSTGFRQGLTFKKRKIPNTVKANVVGKPRQ